MFVLDDKPLEFDNILSGVNVSSILPLWLESGKIDPDVLNISFVKRYLLKPCNSSKLFAGLSEIQYDAPTKSSLLLSENEVGI